MLPPGIVTLSPKVLLYCVALFKACPAKIFVTDITDVRATANLRGSVHLLFMSIHGFFGILAVFPLQSCVDR